MIAVGIDPGTARLGYGVIDEDGPSALAYGVVETPSQLAMPQRLSLLFDGVSALIAEHRPDLVLHGHAHSGTFAGDIDGVPVHNVAAQLLDGPVHVFELDGRRN